MIRKLCMTDEKWFASGESNVFHISREDVKGLKCIMIRLIASSAKKIFETR